MPVPDFVVAEFGESHEIAQDEWVKFLEHRLLREQWEHEKTRRQLRIREIELQRMRDTLYKERVKEIVDGPQGSD
jgi:hypothetical protein